MKRALLLVPLLALATAREARADIFSLRAEAHVGGGGGVGLGGGDAAKKAAFFDGATGGAYGGLVGVEVFFLDVWVEHHQYVGRSSLDNKNHFLGTWTQFMTGLDLDFERRATVTPAEQKKGVKGKKKSYLEIGIGFGYGVGTGQQVDLPLDATQLTDKGFLVEGRFSAGFWMGEHAGLGLGITIPISGGYFFKSGFANNADNQYYAVEGAALLVVRGKLKIK
jgi:hypothetical protein